MKWLQVRRQERLERFMEWRDGLEETEDLGNRGIFVKL